MADADARILDMVRRELEKDRSVATEDLFEKAKKIDPQVANLTARQFHAKYPLQIKRAMKRGRRGAAKKAGGRKGTAGKRGGARRARGAKKAAAKKATTKAAAPAKRGRRGPAKRGRRAAATAATAGAAGARSGSRDVRGLLLQFAKQVAQAEGKAEMVDVLAGIDGWVDRIESAATR